MNPNMNWEMILGYCLIDAYCCTNFLRGAGDLLCLKVQNDGQSRKKLFRSKETECEKMDLRQEQKKKTRKERKK